MRHSPTASEWLLWQLIKRKQLGIAFRRQVPVGGKYIVDFLASSVKLVVEIDGGYHCERQRADASRDGRLLKAGYRVLRLPDSLVLQLPGAAAQLIVQALRLLR
jgi:type I restriction enzyme R subunit